MFDHHFSFSKILTPMEFRSQYIQNSVGCENTYTYCYKWTDYEKLNFYFIRKLDCLFVSYTFYIDIRTFYFDFLNAHVLVIIVSQQILHHNLVVIVFVLHSVLENFYFTHTLLCYEYCVLVSKSFSLTSFRFSFVLLNLMLLFSIYFDIIFRYAHKCYLLVFVFSAVYRSMFFSAYFSMWMWILVGTVK